MNAANGEWSGMYGVRQIIMNLREGRFTSFGCYPKFFYTADGETLSFEAVRAELGVVLRATRDGGATRYNDQWRVVGCAVNWEDPDMYCAHTNERIESACAEDEAVSR